MTKVSVRAVGSAALGALAAATVAVTAGSAVHQVGVAGRAALATTAVVVPGPGDATTTTDGEPASRSTETRAQTAAHAASTAWVTEMSAATGIGTVAMQSYGNAALTTARDEPDCHLGWTTLAALGTIESANGTHGGVELLADGRTSGPILGPALDGERGTASIPARAEDVAWHGDPLWSHAVGPMQFLPSTWARWGADGDGDGLLDPNDLDDAALAAARYLCASGRDLADPTDWESAVLSYNRDDAYLELVLTTANGYAAAAGR